MGILYSIPFLKPPFWVVFLWGALRDELTLDNLALHYKVIYHHQQPTHSKLKAEECYSNQTTQKTPISNLYAIFNLDVWHPFFFP